MVAKELNQNFMGEDPLNYDIIHTFYDAKTIMSNVFGGNKNTRWGHIYEKSYCLERCANS